MRTMMCYTDRNYTVCQDCELVCEPGRLLNDPLKRSTLRRALLAVRVRL